MGNLADAFDSQTLTEDQLVELRRQIGLSDSSRAEVKILAGRAAIFQKGGSAEAVQFVTASNAHQLKWIVAGWSTHFEDLARAGREK